MDISRYLGIFQASSVYFCPVACLAQLLLCSNSSLHAHSIQRQHPLHPKAKASIPLQHYKSVWSEVDHWSFHQDGPLVHRDPIYCPDTSRPISLGRDQLHQWPYKKADKDKCTADHNQTIGFLSLTKSWFSPSKRCEINVVTLHARPIIFRSVARTMSTEHCDAHSIIWHHFEDEHENL